MTTTKSSAASKVAKDDHRKLAVITGASTGIGFHLAQEFARHHYDLLIVANEDQIERSAEVLRSLGSNVDAYNIDLSLFEGVEKFANAVDSILTSSNRHVDALVLNAGTVVYGDFMRHNSLQDELRLINLNVASVVHLAKLIVPKMISRDDSNEKARVLITASIAALMPGPLYATYAASKAFLLSFAEALRNELSDTRVTVTALMPGATETPIFERAGMEHSVVGESSKDDPADVARQAFEALMNGDDHILAASLKTKIQGMGAKFLPDRLLAAMHRQKTKPAH